jgi:hypothetical protein
MRISKLWIASIPFRLHRCPPGSTTGMPCMRARESVSESCPAEGLKHTFRWLRRLTVFADFCLVLVGSLQDSEKLAK